MDRVPSGTKERVLSLLQPSRRAKAPLRCDGGRGLWALSTRNTRLKPWAAVIRRCRDFGPLFLQTECDTRPLRPEVRKPSPTPRHRNPPTRFKASTGFLVIHVALNPLGNP